MITYSGASQYKLFRDSDGAWEENQVSPTGVADELASVPGTGALWASGGEGRTPYVWTNS